MDMKMQAFLDKVKDMADKTGKVSRHAAGVAGKKANDLALATRINLQIFDLNTECEALYKEIGKLVYDLHRGAEVFFARMVMPRSRSMSPESMTRSSTT